MTTLTADQILYRYESLGAEEVEDILEHFGTKGMQWGVRRRMRITRTADVGKGKGNLLDKARVHTVVNRVDLAATGNLKGAATLRAKRLTANNNLTASKGRKRVLSQLSYMEGYRVSDLLPSVRKKVISADKKNKMKKVSAGREFTNVLLAIGPRAALRAGVLALRLASN